jgi:DNA-binding PadR family transcriptional regulator
MLILGVLAERPMHGYEIQQWMSGSRTDLWADVKPGSLYHALKQLDAEGLIRVAEVISQGERSRTVYRITRAGRAELRSLITKGWARPPSSYPADLYTLVTFSRALPRTAVRAYAVALREQVLQTLEEWRTGGQRKLAATSNDPLIAAMIKNGEAHLAADADLLAAIAER